MAQNIYDDPEFLAGYRQLPRSVLGLDGAPEWPALQSMLPAVAGSAVLDLGCGFGWFSRWAAEAGAASVLGLDISEQMLAEAKATTGAEVVTYDRQDLDSFEAAGRSFDLAYSSLTLHYLADLDRLFRQVHAALKPGGSFVFSVEHPIFTAPERPGFVVGATGGNVWPVDGYLAEGRRTTAWLREGVEKYHRTIGAYVNRLVAVGFTIRHLEEWGPTAAQVADHPEWADEVHRPAFLLVRVDRPR